MGPKGGLKYMNLYVDRGISFSYGGGGGFYSQSLSLAYKYAKELGIPNIAKEIQKGIDAKKGLIEELLIVGIRLVVPEKVEQKTGTVGSLGSYCLTGTMSRPRKEIAADIVKAGGSVVDDIRENVVLVQADPSSQSSKSKKANKLGCPIISEEDLMKRIRPL